MQKIATLFTFILGFSSIGLAITSLTPADVFDSASTVKIKVAAGFSETEECTAVIVSRHLLLTAGHCILPSAKQFPEVEVTGEINGRSQQTFHIVKWGRPKEYRDGETKKFYEVQFDLAYLVLREDIVAKFGLNPSQVPKVVPDRAELRAYLDAANFRGMAYGFGVSNTKLSDTKTEGEMHIAVHDVITVDNQAFGVDSIRASGVAPGVGVCQGDSGSGLFVKNVKEHGPRLLIGILSGTYIPKDKACGASGSYASYLNLTPHICWIQKNSGVDLGKTNCPL